MLFITLINLRSVGFITLFDSSIINPKIIQQLLQFNMWEITFDILPIIVVFISWISNYLLLECGFKEGLVFFTLCFWLESLCFALLGLSSASSNFTFLISNDCLTLIKSFL